MSFVERNLPFVVRSRPVYPIVEKNTLSEHHLFIALGDMTRSMSELYQSCCESEKTLALVDNDIDAALSGKIDNLPMATTVYVAGDEGFVWKVSEYLVSKGILSDQIKRFSPKDKSRQVFCCHCYQVTSKITHSPSQCGGCGRMLTVSDHFSRKYGAYMGYQVNAEDPNDLPVAEELS